MQRSGARPFHEDLTMFTLPDGFDLSLFIGDIVTYIGIPVISIAFSIYVYKLITYIMHLGAGSK